MTADFIYLRLHGPNGKYVGSYSENFLNKWAKKLHQWAHEGKNIYCFFDNTADGSAVINALYLKKLLLQQPVNGQHP